MYNPVKLIGIPLVFVFNFIYLYGIFKMYFLVGDENIFNRRKLIFVIGYIVVIALAILLLAIGQHQLSIVILKTYYIVSSAIFILALATFPMGIVFALIGGYKLFWQILLTVYLPLVLLVIINFKLISNIKLIIMKAL